MPEQEEGRESRRKATIAGRQSRRKAVGTGRMRRIEYFPVPRRLHTQLTTRSAVVTVNPVRLLDSSSQAVSRSLLRQLLLCDFGTVTLLTFRIILILLLDATSCEKLSYLHRLLLSSSLEAPCPKRVTDLAPPLYDK